MKRKTFSKGRKESRRAFRRRKIQSLKARTPEEFRVLSFNEFVRRANNFNVLFRGAQTQIIGELERKNLVREFEALKRTNSVLFRELSEAVKDLDALSSGRAWILLMEKFKNPYKAFKRDWPTIRRERASEFRIDLRLKQGQIRNAQDQIKLNRVYLAFPGENHARLEEEIASKTAEISRLQDEIGHIERQINTFGETPLPSKDSIEFKKYLKGLEREKLVHSSAFMKKFVKDGLRLYSLLYKAYKAFRRFNPRLQNSDLFR